MKRLAKSAAPPYGANGHAALGAGPFQGRLPDESLRCLEKFLAKQWKRYRRELKRSQKKYSEKAIHDYRVQTRRLLSTVELLAGFVSAGRAKEVRRALKGNLDLFDNLRDAHVALPIVRSLRRSFAAARPFEKYLRKREARFARQTRKRLKELRNGRLGKLIAACCRQVKKARRKSQPRKANARLEASVHRAFLHTSHLRAEIDPRDTRTIHCTRVAFKRFRYMFETLAGLLPAPADRLLDALHDYQTKMGGIQDAVVLQALFDKFLCRADLPLESVRQLRDELRRRLQRLIEAYLQSADELHQFWAWPESNELRPPGSDSRVPPASATRGRNSRNRK